MLTLRQLASILRARHRLALAVAGTIIALTALVSFLWPRSYTATATLLVDVKAADPMGGAVLGASLPPPVLQSYLATQIQIIQSERTALAVIKALGLAADERARERWEKVSGGEGSFEIWLADQVRKNLEVKPSRDSQLVNVTYTARDRKEAARFANAFAQASVRTDVELKARPARESAEFFDERARKLRAQLEEAQARLSAFQRKSGITVTDEKVDVENTRLTELSSQLTIAQALAADAAARQREAQSGAGALPEAVANPLIQALKADLGKQEAKLKELSAQFGPNHPQYQRAENEVKELRARLSAELAQVTSSVGTAARANRQREAELRAAVEAQRRRVLALRQQRDEVALLQREVESAEKAYEAVAQRRTQTSIESLANLTNLSILSMASEPLRHTSPRLTVNLALGIFFGGLLGVAAAFLRESWDRRIRDADDLASVVRFPLLGVVADSSARDGPAGAHPPLLPGPSSPH